MSKHKYEEGWKCLVCGEVGSIGGFGDFSFIQWACCMWHGPFSQWVCKWDGTFVPKCCSKCGNMIPSKFSKVPVVKVKTSKWWNPFSWFDYMWIEKKHFESDSLQVRDWEGPEEWE